MFRILKGSGIGGSKTDSNASPKHKKEEPEPELTPLDKMLLNAGPLSTDGSDKFFGLENFGNTCYCNSILQALYYSEPFRENVVNYPLVPPGTPNAETRKVNVTIRAPAPAPTPPATGKEKKTHTSQAMKARQALTSGQTLPNGQPLRPEDRPDAPEYKKKQAMIKGPVLELAQDNPDAYDMQECTFTGLKDIFTALIETNTRTGVLSPQRFLDIFKRDNEMFRNSMHQDAHEFYGLVLNDVIANVEATAKRMQTAEEKKIKDGLVQSVERALGSSAVTTSAGGSGTRTPNTGWVHDIFEGVLTSETKCLTCETASQRDETFLDLSIDLEEHSSVTSCLRKFSREEMLCERNKFHCDHCGGLQEAEKRMKIKKLPKILALHLKRFKYTEDYSRLQKLFHRVVYPYHMRMFNTTDDAYDPDRLYELYAVVVHIGGNAYHGHYVSVIKTKDRGWLLFDDEMVEPVDKHFVRNFFGDRPGMACAYVLFYQEVSFEQVREELDAEGLEEVMLASQQADIALGVDHANGAAGETASLMNMQPALAVDTTNALATLNQVKSAPGDINPDSTYPSANGHTAAAASPTHLGNNIPPVPPVPKIIPAPISPTKPKDKPLDKKELKAQEKELKALEKARKIAEKEKARQVSKEQTENLAKILEIQKAEREQLARVLRESKLAAEEEERKRNGDVDAPALTAGPSGPEKHRDKSPVGGFLSRAGRGSKSMTRKSFAFLNSSSGSKGDKDKDKESERAHRSDKSDAGGGEPPHHQNGVGGSTSSHSPIRATTTADRTETSSSSAVGGEEAPHEGRSLKSRFSFGLKRKKSGKFLS
ncbi:c29a97b9-1f7f-4f6a-91d9-6aabf74b05ed [Podospora conica]|nr:c29a97b9-1f7f-4f6a-91d9-6aabf74b05ed [Schizothecium conicum]